jgi:hypothetical protein
MKWTKVKDSLPREMKPVIAAGHCCDMCSFTIIAEVDEYGTWYESKIGEELIFPPEFWIYIPEVPETEKL